MGRFRGGKNQTRPLVLSKTAPQKAASTPGPKLSKLTMGNASPRKAYWESA